MEIVYCDEVSNIPKSVFKKIHKKVKVMKQLPPGMMFLECSSQAFYGRFYPLKQVKKRMVKGKRVVIAKNMDDGGTSGKEFPAGRSTDIRHGQKAVR